MTVSSTSNKAQFNGNGGTVEFPFTFKVFAAADLSVILGVIADGTETSWALTTDYTVTLNADQNNNPGGYITAVVAPATGERITLLRVLDELQETDITNGGGFYPEVIEDALDRVTMLVQQLDEEVSRAITTTVTDGTAYSATTLVEATQAQAAIAAGYAQDAANAAALAAGYINLVNITDYGYVNAAVTDSHDYGSL